jgi:hypothetical protein
LNLAQPLYGTGTFTTSQPVIRFPFDDRPNPVA